MWKGKLKWKENVANCACSSSQQRGVEGGVGEGKKSQVKSSISCLPNPIFLGAGRSQPLHRLVSKRGGAGGKGLCLLQFSMILFNPDTNLATKPNSGTGLQHGILDQVWEWKLG